MESRNCGLASRPCHAQVPWEARTFHADSPSSPDRQWRHRAEASCACFTVGCWRERDRANATSSRAFHALKRRWGKTFAPSPKRRCQVTGRQLRVGAWNACRSDSGGAGKVTCGERARHQADTLSSFPIDRGSRCALGREPSSRAAGKTAAGPDFSEGERRKSEETGPWSHSSPQVRLSVVVHGFCMTFAWQLLT